ncbi:MAG: FAD-dependent oxidoreductase, partial [Verrucomicrobia bacterium]|nr:FAD-dependent oxidoreductase [Verrucomicrobiota bacterium]
MKIIFTSALLAFFLSNVVVAAEVVEADLCVFGGTSGGVAAAIQAARMGKSVVIANPTRFLGGLTTGGLGATDIGNKAAVGGISREFYHRIAQHYAKPSSWQFETAEEYFARRKGGQAGQSSLSGADATMWTFEPRVAEKVFFEMLKEAKVPVYLDQRLASVMKNGTRITEIAMENRKVFRAKMFIDATYEGDLMAKAKVSYHVGREANATYGETLNGIRAETPKHQFTVPVDPYVKPGDASSG